MSVDGKIRQRLANNIERWKRLAKRPLGPRERRFMEELREHAGLPKHLSDPIVPGPVRDRLIRKGFVALERPQDRADGVLFSLTSKGRAKLDESGKGE